MQGLLNRLMLVLALTALAPAAVAQGLPPSLSAFQDRVAANDPQAIADVGYAYDVGKGVDVDLAKAASWYRRAAELGHKIAMSNLAGMLLNGRGVPRNDAEARVWYQKAADLGEASAAEGLGWMYANGRIGKIDDVQALFWYRRAAALNFPLAVFRIGYAHDTGRGVPQNFAEAASWYQRAAALNEPSAIHNLGVLHLDGRGVPQSDAEALSWFRQAAALGLPDSMYTLGWMYRNGRGVPTDLREARRWYEAAAGAGRTDARQALATLDEAERAKQASAAQSSASAPMSFAATSSTGPRVALIIGNTAYDSSLGRLSNAVNDADTMHAALKAVGFDVEVKKDLDQREMKRAIVRFGERLRAGGAAATGLFFYAGHGAQSNGINYLVPLDARIEAEADLDVEAVTVESILRQMEGAGAKTSIVILDACRNLPMARRFRNGMRGLARIEAPTGSFVAYSTAPGAAAADGTGRNSPYVTALAGAIGIRGKAIESVFRDVRRQVLEATQGKQTPWETSSLLYDFSFVQ